MPVTDADLTQARVTELSPRGQRLLLGCPLTDGRFERVGERVPAAIRAADGGLPLPGRQSADVGHHFSSAACDMR
jgi:hypothetical protein